MKSINITPCEAEPCTLNKGTSVDVIMTGTSYRDVERVELTVDAQLGQRVPILAENVCGSNIECPLQASSEWTMNYALYVDNRLHDGNALTRWKLIGNGEHDEIMCADIQLNVV